MLAETVLLRWQTRPSRCSPSDTNWHYAMWLCHTLAQHGWYWSSAESIGKIRAIFWYIMESLKGVGELQGPVTRSFDVFLELRPNKRLGKQWWGWWFETPSRPLWRHCNVSHYNLRHLMHLVMFNALKRVLLNMIKNHRNLFPLPHHLNQ